MTRANLAKLAALALTIVIMVDWPRARADLTATAKISRLSVEERAELLQYATDPWRSFQLLAQPSGLPADSLSRDATGWGNPSMQTSPTNIAAYLWSTLAASRLEL